MATASKILVSPSLKPVYAHGTPTQASTDAVNDVLQRNHDEHHIFYDERGFHNHIVHQTLTLYALGASDKIIHKQYNDNVSYQRPKPATSTAVISDMTNPDQFASHLGKAKQYSNFLAYFKDEINHKGWQNVLNEQLFARTPRADDMLVRLFSGVLHPMIHLGFGIEFEQPAIIAEALAQAAVHNNLMRQVYYPAERKASESKSSTAPVSLAEIFADLQADERLRKAVHYEDEDRIVDGILVRAPDAMIAHAARFTASPATLERQTAEMINLCTYFSASAQEPTHRKPFKYSFFQIHAVNASIFYSAINAQKWLKIEDKVRLLEWKVRTDLVIYVSVGAPASDLTEVQKYQSMHSAKVDWTETVEKSMQAEDDGHIVKLVRALAHGEVTCTALNGPQKKGLNWNIEAETWPILGHLAVESAAGQTPQFVRLPGFVESWDQIEDRKRALL